MAPPGRLCAGRAWLVGGYGRRALWRVEIGTYLRQRPGLSGRDEGVADHTAVDRGATAARTRPCADDAAKGAAARRADRSPRYRFRGGGRVADQSAHADGSRCVVGYTRCRTSQARGASAPCGGSRAGPGGGARVDTYIALSYWDLAAASVLVFINAGLSVIFRLRVHRSLLIAAIRMVVQLTLVGLVLTTLFSVVSPLWTGLAALGMVLFAGHEAAQRQERGLSGWWSYGLGTGSMMVSSVLVTVFALLTALRPNPWYDPRYAIPLLGMILGNCMTGIALGLDTLPTSLVSRRAGVEAQLMLGATRQEAVAPVTRQALRSALMPTINSMSATGVVSPPGIMIGQILGGVPPAEAVKYQILVMFLIAGGTGLGAVTAVLGGVYRLIDGRHRLRLDRLRPPKPA